MKIFTIALGLVFSLTAFAGLNMKPGLWEIKMNMQGADGGQKDPMAEMHKAMAGMSPEQKKQMAAMMGKVGSMGSMGAMGTKGKMPAPAMGLSPAGNIQVCYTKEMLENEESITKQQGKKCKTDITKKTSTNVVANFKCEDGTSGVSNWTIKNATSYLGKVDIKDKDGKKTHMTFNGKFAKADCGNIKPKTTK